jgi:hypothetical protein
VQIQTQHGPIIAAKKAATKGANNGGKGGSKSGGTFEVTENLARVDRQRENAPMPLQGIFERQAIVDDHIDRTEGGLGDMGAIRTGKDGDFVIFAGDVENGLVNENFGFHVYDVGESWLVVDLSPAGRATSIIDLQ